MKKYNLLCKIKRHPNGITKADSEAQKSENLIKQDFSAEKPNEKWLTDISEVECSDGKFDEKFFILYAYVNTRASPARP